MGVMALAKGLKRTLVLPPWVVYSPGQRKPDMVPWDTFFQVRNFIAIKELIQSFKCLVNGNTTLSVQG